MGLASSLGIGYYWENYYRGEIPDVEHTSHCIGLRRNITRQ